MNDPAEKPAIARNVLTNAALIRLTDWARQNVESCQTLSNKTLATMAGETLNLHLTSANIASALEAVNITKIKPKAPPSLEERITELESTVSTQGLHIAGLESNLSRAIQLIKKGILDIGKRSIIPTPANSGCGISFSIDLPEPTQIQAIATDGPITVMPPPLHGLPDLDTAAAEVKAEPERHTPIFEGPTLVEPQPIHQAAAAIADQP